MRCETQHFLAVSELPNSLHPKAASAHSCGELLLHSYRITELFLWEGPLRPSSSSVSFFPACVHLELTAAQIISGLETKGFRKAEADGTNKVFTNFPSHLSDLFFSLSSRRLAAVTCAGKCSVHQRGLGICRLIFVLSITFDSWKNNLSVLGQSLTCSSLGCWVTVSKQAWRSFYDNVFILLLSAKSLEVSSQQLFPLWVVWAFPASKPQRSTFLLPLQGCCFQTQSDISAEKFMLRRETQSASLNQSAPRAAWGERQTSLCKAGRHNQNPNC